MKNIFWQVLLVLLQLFVITKQVNAQQNFKQSIKGVVMDAESKKPLAGVTVEIDGLNLKAVSDNNGFYIIRDIPVGKQTLKFTTIGYEQRVMQNITLTSGKEMEQDVTLTESFKKLDEVQVKASKNVTRPLNDFATVSARSFSVEETKRYPASFSDPARMVMNFPGVNASDDGSNAIVVRGNSPRGVLWKLEGIEIPTPNHFSSLGNTGGPISMLSSNVIGPSDFYTGAFPSEIGNATSAAFDLNFRNGNKDRAEYAAMIGTLGAELSAEGPMGKNRNASYLINYRYSTLAVLKNFINLNGQVPEYQDLSFKFNWATKKAGTFSLFGLGGINKSSRDAKTDSTKWDTLDEPNASYSANGTLGVAGLSHQIFVSPNAYFKTVISASYTKSKSDADTLNPHNNYVSVPTSHESFTDKALRLSVYFNDKLDVHNTIRIGMIAQQLYYDLKSNYYDDDEHKWKDVLQGSGSSQFYQAYIQWKYRVNNQLTFNAGVNGSYLALNKAKSIEPRAAVSYKMKYGQTLSLAAGLHSRPEHISTYMFENVADGQPHTLPNKNLDMSRAFHVVGGYEKYFSLLNIRAKVEAYYQYLYKIPVEEKIPSGFSAINMDDVYSLQDKNRLVSEGHGRNYGVDLSLEKPFAANYYFISNLSLFKSTYTNYEGKTFNSRYDRTFSFNFTGGKEWQSARKPNKTIGVSAKLLTSGGLRYSPLDIQKSIASGKQEYIVDQYYTERGPMYFRLDGSIYMKKNRKRSTHTLSLEIQNLTNHQNFYTSFFDKRTGKEKTIYQLGILPNLSYKIEFH
ncbi:MAG: TonB-dependent receptor [Filimonas sp.]|nr:TonB-dependent receptor [Filimonas sp.]